MGLRGFRVHSLGSLPETSIRQVLLQVCKSLNANFIDSERALSGLHSGALGAGLAILSRFPIIGATINPYSLNGSPIEVIQGDWFVGKAAASVLLAHPILGQVQVFNTHVSTLPLMS